MDTYTFFLLVTGTYSVLLFFDLFFKSCAHYPYLKLLEGLGLELSFFTIQWKTKAFNRLIIKWGNTKPYFWKLWFQLGTVVTLSFLPVALFILFKSMFGLFGPKETEVAPPLVTIGLPGINLPISEVGYYCITLLICSFVHEMGHALAGVVEDIGTLELGFNIYFILPVAYVNLPTDKMQSLNVKKRLNIFSAGVWHNFLLSFFAYLLYWSLPWVFSPFYGYNGGVTVIDVLKTSPLRDASKGILENDIITAINDCKINNENDWLDCLGDRNVILPAICIKSDLVNTLDESVPLKHLDSGVLSCCDPKNNKNLCFEYIDIENNELELPGHACLPGRTVMEQATNFCTVKPHDCPNSLYCFKPLLPNGTYLFKITCKSKNIVYLGHSSDLYNTIEISSYVKKSDIFSVSIPNRITKLIKYVSVISLGLAFVNVLPISFMDGEYIMQVAALLMLKSKFQNKEILGFVNMVKWLMTALFFIYLLVSVIFVI
ncbi:membrane-bound transcription factor site-2 protease [Anthonomus grandis grandis]|uniref:membrane-bound transcription factor site-2 protease n=1 Tax=Anthonomus grandis grandis TaxID=2921223 RepID=UPI002165E4A2|nr:membrane-bound transcription factor site-2 protease [Anthonomus grandis grandis]